MSESPFQSLVSALAPAIHEHYRAQAKREGWTMKYDMPYVDLPPDLQHANLAAALRIPRILAAAGLRLISGDEAGDALSDEEAGTALEEHIEAAAIAEHEGWMAEKLESGWKYGVQRDDEARMHPSLVPYTDLPESEKEKDRSAVRNYPAIVRRAGMEIGITS